MITLLIGIGFIVGYILIGVTVYQVSCSINLNRYYKNALKNYVPDKYEIGNYSPLEKEIYLKERALEEAKSRIRDFVEIEGVIASCMWPVGIFILIVVWAVKAMLNSNLKLVPAPKAERDILKAKAKLSLLKSQKEEINNLIKQAKETGLAQESIDLLYQIRKNVKE